MDEVSLKASLMSLREALKHSTFVAEGVDVVAGYDRGAAADALQRVLSSFEARPRAIQTALINIASAVQSRAKTEELAATLRSLTTATRMRTESALGSDKLGVISKLLGGDFPDLLMLVGKRYDENAHSDVIRWLLDPKTAPYIAPSALYRLVRRFPNSEKWHEAVGRAVESRCVSVRREYTFGREWTPSASLDRIDIVITGPGFVIAIENKVLAVEHENQTHAYWDWLRGLRGLKAGVFLTPSGIGAACPDFVPVSYLELVSCLLEPTQGAKLSGAEAYVLGGYLKTLQNTLLRTELQAIIPTEMAT